MLDTIYYRSNKEIVLIFTNRSPFTLYSSHGNVMALLDEFRAPLDSGCNTLTEWNYRVRVGSEDTQVIYLDEVA